MDFRNRACSIYQTVSLGSSVNRGTGAGPCRCKHPQRMRWPSPDGIMRGHRVLEVRRINAHALPTADCDRRRHSTGAV